MWFDWSARWIEPHEAHRSAHVLRHTFRLHAPVTQARLYATAHGIYEAFLNGRRVGDVELAPDFTSYPAPFTCRSTTSATCWWPATTSGRSCSRTAGGGGTPVFQLADGYGSTLAFLGQLQADDLVIATGPGWESSTGPL